MHSQDFLFALAALALGSVTLVTIAKTIGKVVIARRISGSAPEGVTALEERVARLEHTVEALTVDSDRLIDGQRFLSQLLTEKSNAAPQTVARSK